ncbi:MAG TPA: hypothetical protein VGB91_08505 [Rhizomicrobium sp.]
MKDFDPKRTYTSFHDHLHKAKTPKQREHLDTVMVHSSAEVAGDLPTLLGTLSEEPYYVEYGAIVSSLEDTGPKGMDAVKKYYTGMVENGSYVIESIKNRVVVADDEIVTSGSFRQVLTAHAAKSLGLVSQDSKASDYYLLSARTIVFWDFDQNGKASGEERYVLNHRVEPLAQEDLPSNFPAHLRKA